MYVYTQENGTYYARAPLDKIECCAPTAAEAAEELKRAVAFHRFRIWHEREVRRATKVAYDPGQRCYVADCREMGVVGTGFTRHEAREKVFEALRKIALSQLDEMERDGTPLPTQEDNGQV